MSNLESNEGQKLDGVTFYTNNPGSPFAQWMEKNGAKNANKESEETESFPAEIASEEVETPIRNISSIRLAHTNGPDAPMVVQVYWRGADTYTDCALCGPYEAGEAPQIVLRRDSFGWFAIVPGEGLVAICLNCVEEHDPAAYSAWAAF